MCSIKRNVSVEEIKAHLRFIADSLEEAGEVKGTVVQDENYASVTAIIGNQVMCINFMN